MPAGKIKRGAKAGEVLARRRSLSPRPPELVYKCLYLKKVNHNKWKRAVVRPPNNVTPIRDFEKEDETESYKSRSEDEEEIELSPMARRDNIIHNLAASILELTGSASRDNKKNKIIPPHKNEKVAVNEKVAKSSVKALRSL
ncbi:hypothetical protein M9H77_29762 [Catharanthus roseus]|uniref:Uncharacterized protein n=1 Tax=Catharanthus roseus TaxID=4058 RepID=A0ACB9ZWD7_CATRO|nr:hypothetical protein M9H77_29762 [Catharanthus roseus]